jgi:hypothetical protein
MESPPPIPDSPTAEPQPATTSLLAKLFNVFAVPGEVFDEVKAAPASAATWLVPALLLAVVGALSAFVLFSQPAILQQIREQQDKAIEQQVKAGKITQAQADQYSAMMEKFFNPTVLKLFGAAGGLAAAFCRVVWWGFILWLLAKQLLKTSVPFPKALEVSGLSMMISVLGMLVGLLLTVNLGRLGAGASLALVVKDFDLTRKSHLFAGAANLFSFWQVAVTSIGLAKLANAPFMRAAWVVLAFWMLQESVLILIGMGQWAL